MDINTYSIKEIHMQKVIAISTDYNYITPVETLIKSIAYHNKNVKIYVINEDIPQEWFINLNRRLQPLQIEVADAKFDPALINDEKISWDYLSKMAYGRILIPELIPEDRVLYLDADTIVVQNLDNFFNYDLQGYPIGAIQEYFDPTIFNSGVLLMDNARLRQTNFVHDLLERGKQATADNDQTILNEEFKNNYRKLPASFNVQIGGDLVTFYDHDHFDMYKEKVAASQPYTVIHYTTSSKPWNTTNLLRFRQIWWQYKDLEYDEIVNRKPLPDLNLPNKKGTLFTFTNSENIKDLYRLAAALPEYEIHVAAYTVMGDKLIRALRYPNVRLHPSMTRFTFDKLLQETTAYLDINYGSKNPEIIKQFLDKGIPAYSFASVTCNELKDADNYTVLADDDFDQMINTIKQN